MILIPKNKNTLFSSLLLLSISKRIYISATPNMSSETCNKNQSSQTDYQYAAAYVTTPNEEVAKNIARGLVKEKLAACVNIIPQITSIYEWENKINEDSEVLMMIKTKPSRIDQLIKFVKENHPYSVCEVISVPITNGNKPYLKWIDDVLIKK